MKIVQNVQVSMFQGKSAVSSVKRTSWGIWLMLQNIYVHTRVAPKNQISMSAEKRIVYFVKSTNWNIWLTYAIVFQRFLKPPRWEFKRKRVNVKSKNCQHENCPKHPAFNVENMVNVKDNTCEHENCTKRPNYNFPDQLTRKYCAEHRLPSMISMQKSIVSLTNANNLPCLDTSINVRNFALLTNCRT
jgi:hypothetical protein